MSDRPKNMPTREQMHVCPGNFEWAYCNGDCHNCAEPGKHTISDRTRRREGGEEVQKIEQNTPLGKLCAAPSGDLDYPGISVYIERPDGVQIDLVSVDVENLSKIAAAYIYEDTEQEGWTNKFVWRAKDVEEV